MIQFLSGKNDFAISQHIMKVRRQYEQKYADGLEAIDLDLQEVSYASLEQAILAQPMFFSHRLVMVRSLVNAVSYIDSLIKLLDKVPESTVLILDGRGLDKRSAIYKQLVKIPGAKLYEPLNEADLVRWLQREAAGHDAKLAPGDARYLIKRAGSDQWRLQQEVLKLSAANNAPTQDLIKDLVHEDLTASVFDLIALIQQHNPAAALKRLDDLLISGANEQQLIGTLQWHYRVLALAAFAATESEILAAGLKPYAVSRVQSSAHSLGRDGVAQGYQALLQADAAIKSGDKKPHQAMTDLVLTLSG